MIIYNKIKRKVIVEWIQEIGEGSYMLTISKVHAKAQHLKLTLEDLEPTISKIIYLTNGFVFGKHKHFEFLKGVIVCEHFNTEPHFHIIFQKPNKFDSFEFNKKLQKASKRLCDEKFEFNLNDSYLPAKTRYFLSHPCYPDFVKVSNFHMGLGLYLTKKVDTCYFLLTDRKVVFKRDLINVRIDYTF